MKSYLYIDDHEIMLIYGRPRRDVLKIMERERAAIVASRDESELEETVAPKIADPIGMKLNDVVVNTFCEHVLRKIQGVFPSPEDSTDIEDFMKANGLEGRLKTHENQVAFLKDYYFMELLYLATDLLESGVGRTVSVGKKKEVDVMEKVNSLKEEIEMEGKAIKN